MQSKFTRKRIGSFLKLAPVLLLLILCGTSSHAQQYVNGVLSTGATSISGVAAPAGWTWSECQNPTGNTTVANTNAGYGAQISANNAMADDFTVIGSWNLTKITVYAYSTGFVGTVSPFNDLRIRIHNSSPLAGPTTVVFGDMTTNRLSSSTSTSVYRIFNTVVTPATPPNTTRIIWKLEANVSVTLPAGTYWLEYQTGTALASNFTPNSSPIGVRTLPGYNAIQRIGTAWAAAVDLGQGSAASPVAIDMPFIIDYTTGPCAGTPNPGNTISSAASVCPGINFNLSLQNGTPGAGVTYQWQSGPSATGPWTNIVGATNPTYSTSQTASTYYQAIVTCSGNPPGTSTPVQVLVTPPSGCYCAAGATSTAFEKISNVQFGTINNTSSSTAGYENFTAISTNVIAGETLPLRVTISGPFASDQVLAWIDFNQDGDFTDAGEQVATSAQGVGPHVLNVTISPTATLGSTRMRIRMHDAALGPNATPCGNSTYGQVEDYTVNIGPCVQGQFTSGPANTSIQCSGNATFTVATTGSALSYQWEYKTSAASPFWLPITNTGVYSGAFTPTLTVTNAPATMSGYVYRAVIQGPCTGIDVSSAATLTVTPLIATVTPSSATICTGTIQQLTLTNASSPATVSFTNNTPLPIPDANAAGVQSTLPVSGIPAGAIVTEIKVLFNIPAHTYVGDLSINLIGPNNVVMNLVGELDGGTGSNATDGFVNTTFSSLGGSTISGFAAPRTGTFTAERRVGYGPTGFQQTSAATNWANLLTTLNGNWKLAIADPYNLDVGTLTNWTISITYGAPAAGIWTGPAGTMWTDAGATVPYVAGTPMTSIYVNPTATTNYTVVYSTPTPCTSAPTVIPVNVVNPVTAVVNPVNTAACVGNNATFTVSAGGGPLSYQWQRSIDAGLTWNNISGATGSTLTVTGVTSSMTGYRYRAIVSAPPCGGSTTSGSATLTVNALPIVAISSADLSLAPGQTTTITATSTPAAAANGWSWTLDNGAIAGTTNSQTVGIDAMGVYQARVVDVNGCVAFSNELTIGAEASDRLWIYPNPSAGAFQVRLYYGGPVTERRVVRIFKSNGQLVMEKEFTLDNIVSPYLRMDFDLSNLASGTYVVKVDNTITGKITSGLVVIQHD
jgi:subtilisin-like proprotein convertase family protein